MMAVPSGRRGSTAICGSYDLLPRELIDLALRIAELGKDIVGVRAQLWRRHARPWIAARKPETRTHDLNRAADAGGIVEISQQLALYNLRMLEDSRHVQHRASRNTVLIKDDGPIARGLTGKRCLDLGIELEAIALAILPPGEAWIGDEVLAPDQAAEGLELLLLVGRDVEEALRGAQRAGRTCGHVLVAHRPRPHARNQPVRDDPAHGNQSRLQHRDIDELALAAALAPKQRRSDCKSSRDASHGVGHRIADPQRRRLLISGYAHDAREALNDLVVGGVELERTVLAETGNRTIDQVRPHLFQRRIAELKPLHDAGTEVLNHHTRRGDETTKNVAAFRSLQVERERPLTSVLSQKRCAHMGTIERRIGTELARQIARARHLDFDHIGAELGKLIAAEGAGQHIGQVEDAHTRQKPAHRSSAVRSKTKPPLQTRDSSLWLKMYHGRHKAGHDHLFPINQGSASVEDWLDLDD